MAIFRFLRWRPPPSWIFEIFDFSCISFLDIMQKNRQRAMETILPASVVVVGKYKITLADL